MHRIGPRGHRRRVVRRRAGRSHELPDRVLVNVGTTLLLVGIVVLLERRIVDNAVRKFRNPAEEARARMRDYYASKSRTSRIP
jgi:hypothetical protein